MSKNIHPTAVVDPKAKISEGVLIEPYCIIGPDVTLKKDVHLHSHVVVTGQTTIGENTEVFPFVTIGEKSQSILQENMKTAGVIIGKNNVFREFVTINGSPDKNYQTQIGNGCHFLLGCHIAHDCVVGNNVVMSNNATLGGHVIVEDHVTFGGFSGIHQFCKVGAYAMIGAMAKVVQDVIPYSIVDGQPATLRGLNVIGLNRNNFSKEKIHELRDALQIIFESKEGVFEKRVKAVQKEFKDHKEIQKLADFILTSERGVCKF
jgi:UDP-N-acetylglucosamine acyltransferase